MPESIDRLDPECRAALELYVAGLPSERPTDIVERRAAAAEMARAAVEAAGGPETRVTREDVTVPGLDDDPDVPVRLYRPVEATGTLPGILLIHGGGMISGSIEGEDASAAVYSLEVGAVVVSVEYRLAPEDPHPAQSRDCFAALKWMAQNATALNFDPARLAVVGGSAGGNLALTTALIARDEGDPSLRFVLSDYPMLDPANIMPSAREIAAQGMWAREDNTEAWGWFLGDGAPDKYASPMLETDWAGFPPTFIDVGTEDLFRDEDSSLVSAMARQGVMVEFHLYPGAYHCSELVAPDAELSRRIVGNRLGALRRALVVPAG